jgi:hypothetical protein
MNGPTRLHVAAPVRQSDLPNLRVGERSARALAGRIEAALAGATAAQRAPLEAARAAAEKCAAECTASVAKTIRLEADLEAADRALADAEHAAQKARAREQELYALTGELDEADALARRDAHYLAGVRVVRVERARDAARFALAAIVDPWRILRRVVTEAEDGNHRLGGAVHQGAVQVSPVMNLAHLGFALAHEDAACEQFVKDEKKTHRPVPVARLRDVFKQRLALSLTAIATAQSEADRVALLASIRDDVRAAVGGAA